MANGSFVAFFTTNYSPLAIISSFLAKPLFSHLGRTFEGFLAANASLDKELLLRPFSPVLLHSPNGVNHPSESSLVFSELSVYLSIFWQPHWVPMVVVMVALGQLALGTPFREDTLVGLYGIMNKEHRQGLFDLNTGDQFVYYTEVENKRWGGGRRRKKENTNFLFLFQPNFIHICYPPIYMTSVS